MTVDGENIPNNSKLHDNKQIRFQEWVDDLPGLLCDECHEQNFAITFHGTALDYEDLKESLETYSHTSQNFKFSLQHLPAKEAQDKIVKIQEIFANIQDIKNNTELKNLRGLTSDALVDAFESALNDEFEVFVVATMSAGKSTLINALLGRKLMPSKQEACTAVITRVKDVDSEDSNAPYRAVAYDALIGGNEVETVENLRLEDMERLNADSRVRRIEVEGDILFVSSAKTSLVLIDTPGPNNARTKTHESVQQKMLDSKAKPLILYVMTGEFGTNDDKKVLQNVAKSMSAGGKQSRDRFLFVVNKLDGRKKEDGTLKDFLQGVREHLERNGIPTPTIFPAAALPALNIRLWQADSSNLSKYEQRETRGNILKFNEILHLDEEASLPLSLWEEIEQSLTEARCVWQATNGEYGNNPEEALIHTGIPSIEVAIRQYVEKYAKTAKIRNLAEIISYNLGRIEQNVCNMNKSEQAFINHIRTGIQELLSME